MSKPSLRRFSKPSGFDQRIRRELGGRDLAADAEPLSLAVARSRAEKLNVSVDEMLVGDRERLRASTYPGTDCFEPYEVEEYVAGVLPRERARHIETCQGCAVLLKAVAPTEEQVAAFLDEVRDTEPVREAFRFRVRGFWFDLVGGLATAMGVGAVGYFAFEFIGSIAGDPSTRSAVFRQVTGLVPPALVAGLFAVSLFALTLMLLRYKREFLQSSIGALTLGAALGLVAIFIGWKNVGDSTDATRAGLKLQQVQMTGAMAASLGPDAMNWGLDVKHLNIEPSSGLSLAASQPEPGRLRFESTVDGLPGAMLVDMQPNGGQLYWDFASKREPLGQILVGTVQSSSTDQFVLVDSDQQKHTIKTAAGYRVVTGSKVMVLINPANQSAVSVHALSSKYSTGG